MIDQSIIDKIDKKFLTELFNFTFKTINANDITSQLSLVASIVFDSGWDRVSISLFDQKYKIKERYFRGVSNEVQEKLWKNPIPPQDIRAIFESEGFKKFLVGNYSRLIRWHELKKLNMKDYFDRPRNSLHRIKINFEIGNELIIPFKAKNRILGMVSVDSPRTNRSFSVENVLLLEHIASLAALNIEFLEILAEKENLYKEMEEMLFEMEESKIRMMNEFLVSNVHDIKSIIGKNITPFLEGIKKDFPFIDGVKKQRERFDKLLYRSREIEEDLQELIDMNKKIIERTEAEEDINRIIRLAIRINESRLLLDDIDIELNLDEKIPYITVNKIEIFGILYNLIANAIDAIEAANKPKRRINISSEKIDKYLRIILEDNGIGIKREHKEKIFAPYFTTKSKKSGGAGIGLSACKKLIDDKYQGTINFNSTYGQGSKFWFEIPFYRRT